MFSGDLYTIPIHYAGMSLTPHTSSYGGHTKEPSTSDVPTFPRICIMSPSCAHLRCFASTSTDTMRSDAFPQMILGEHHNVSYR